jgi:hypothetical protein
MLVVFLAKTDIKPFLVEDIATFMPIGDNHIY